MFGNAIAQTNSPGGRRRGLIWQSGSGSRYRYYRVITKDMFKSYRGSSEYLQIPELLEGVLCSYSSEYDSLKIDTPIGSTYVTTYYKPIRVSNNGYYQDVWSYWQPSNYTDPVWFTDSILAPITGVTGSYKIEPYYSYGILAADLPGYQPEGVTDAYPLTCYSYGSTMDNPYYDKWIVQNQFFDNKGKEYTIAPPLKCYYAFNPPYNFTFPSSAFYDSVEDKYAIIPEQNPIEVIVATGLNFDYTNLLEQLPNSHRLTLTDTFIINKAFTNLIKVQI